MPAGGGADRPGRDSPAGQGRQYWQSSPWRGEQTESEVANISERYSPPSPQGQGTGEGYLSEIIPAASSLPRFGFKPPALPPLHAPCPYPPLHPERNLLWWGLGGFSVFFLFPQIRGATPV